MGKYQSSPEVDAAVAALRAFVRKLLRWPRTQDDQLYGLAKCLVVLEEFPRVNKRLSVRISFNEPMRDLDDGKQKLSWNIMI